MNIRLVRTFHAVGQGAFFSERFCSGDRHSFNIVYDCGALPKKQSMNKIIAGSFNNDEVIDILFISHFDSDHVNGINLLKKRVKKIRNVILPLLGDGEIEFLILFYRILGRDYREIVNLLEDAEGFFGEETNVIRVKPISIMDGELLELENRDAEDVYDLNVSKEKEINSGTKIRVSIGEYKYFWLYKPYNYEIQKRSSQLICALKRCGILEEDLKDIDFVVNNIDKIRKIYKDKKVDGDINENSMLVCSIPLNNNWRLCNIYSECGSLNWFNCNPHYYFYLGLFSEILDIYSAGCIYTGDVNLKKIKMDFFKRFRGGNLIGTVQVAHHGSYKNFDVDFFNETNSHLTCPVSFGSRNNYGHPSDKVLGSLLCNNHFPISINEIRGNSFVQVFDY